MRPLTDDQIAEYLPVRRRPLTDEIACRYGASLSRRSG